jgi:predicted XRE-type DNA-binding protein
LNEQKASEVERVIVDLFSAMIRAFLPRRVLWTNRMNSLVAAILGLIFAGKTNIWDMGVAAPGKASAVNRGKRIGHLLANLNISIDDIAQALLKALTANMTDVIIAIDWTEFGSWKILQAAVVARGRAIPVFWKAVKDGRRRMADVEIQVCEKLIAMTPPGKRLLLLGDRGFDSAEFVVFLLQRGVQFVLRFARSVSVRRSEDIDFVAVSDLPLKVGEVLDYGTVLYTKGSSVPVRLVRTWADGQSQEWNLITNIGTNAVAKLIIKLYGRRFTIEELFRDLKGGGWLLEKTRVRFEESMDRLILVLALAHILVVSIGRWAKKCNLERHFRSTPGLSLFSLGLRVLHEAANGNPLMMPPTGFDPALAELPIRLDEIVHLPWNTKKARRESPKQRIPRDRLPAYMYHLNLRQTEVARIIGCSQASVSPVANGRMSMPPAWIPKLLGHGRMSLTQFLALPARPPKAPAPEPKPIEEKPEIPRDRVRAFLAYGRMTQADLAYIVGSNQPKVSQVASGLQRVPHAWLHPMLEHAKITEQEFYSLPRPADDAPVNNPVSQFPTTAPDIDTSELALRRRAALQALWRKNKQKDLATAAGVGQPDISRAVSGNRNVPERWVKRLCLAYGLTEDGFLALGDDATLSKPA